MSQVVYFILFLLAFASLIVMAEWMYHSLKIGAENIRLLVQVFAGILGLFLPLLFSNEWWVLLICGFIQLGLALSVHFHYLKSITSFKRKTYGSLVFPMIIYLIYLAWYHSGNGQNGTQSFAYFHLPILILALGDPAATIAGRYYPLIRFNRLNKSLGGTMAFWIVSFVLTCVILVYSHLFQNKDITWLGIFIASVASLTELYSKKGLDNLFIPISVLLSMYLVEYFF